MLTRFQLHLAVGNVTNFVISALLGRPLVSSGSFSKTTKPSLSTYSSYYPPLRQSSFSPSVSSRILHVIIVLLRWSLLIPLWVGLFKLTLALVVMVAQALIDGINHIRNQHPHRWQPKRSIKLYGQTGMATPRQDAKSYHVDNTLACNPSESGRTPFIDHLNIDDESGEIPAIYNRLGDGIASSDTTLQDTAIEDTAIEDTAKENDKRGINHCTTLSNRSLGLGWFALTMLLLLIVTWSDLSTITLS